MPFTLHDATMNGGRWMLSAERLWALSRMLYELGLTRPARMIKALSFFLYGALLPYQAQVAPDVRLGHHGTGVVLHPNLTIKERVMIWHGVTIASETAPGSRWRVRVEEDVVIGAGAIIVARGDADLVIGAGSRVGAGAVVTSDVAPGAVVVGVPARDVVARSIVQECRPHRLLG